MRQAPCRKAICGRIKSVAGTQVIPWLVFKTQDTWLLLSVSVENYLIKIHRYQSCRLLFVVVCEKRKQRTTDRNILFRIKVFIFIYCPKCSFFFKHLYWSIIAFQWCVSFCFLTKWISYTYTYIPISPPSGISLPSSLSHPSRWSQSTELISLCYAAASH